MSGERMGHRAGGFVLPFVVFVLFVISLAGTTGYVLVSSEFALSRYAADGAEARAVARAGLERFVAEQLGVVADTAWYAMGGGVAVVTARKVVEEDSLTATYYVRSEATVEDVRAPGSPARRVVGAFAVHHRRPMALQAAVVLGADAIQAQGQGYAHGFDYDDATTCPGGGASSLAGGVARVSVTAWNSPMLQGNPDVEIWPGGWSAIRDSIGIRWDVLSDPDFPVEFENTLPNYATIPSDSFPVVRYTGWVNASWTGRGVLIVDGVFDPTDTFVWEGIVLAREVDDIIQGSIEGVLVGGLEGPNLYSTIRLETTVGYHSCSVYAANESLSYLELIPGSVHEAN